MRRKLIFLLFIIFDCYALKLIPIPINKQLIESDGIVYGQFVGLSYQKTNNGKIITNASFKIHKSIGIESRYLVNRTIFNIHYDGGFYQGFNYHNENAPNFIADRMYVILLKRDSFGFSPYMEKLGVYSLNTSRDSDFLFSQAFPNHPKIGVVPYYRFDLLVRSVYGTYLQEAHSDRHISKTRHRKKIGRSVASIEDDIKSSEDTSIGIFWVTVCFGLLGAMRMRNSKAIR